jgi:hypothetical protein
MPKLLYKIETKRSRLRHTAVKMLIQKNVSGYF